jgi:hypothetical protein
MMVSVARDPDFEGERGFALVGPRSGSMLSHEAGVGAGVRVGVDLMAPDRWLSVSANSINDHSEPVLRALIGDRAVAGLREFVRLPWADRPRDSLAVDPGSSAAWVRVAVVDALDRWLQLPVDQSLLDAERGMALARAAETLPRNGSARAIVVGEALDLARQASSGVVRHLRSVGRRRSVPEPLYRALESMAGDGYADLAGEVQGADDELASVIRAWRAVARSASVVDAPDAEPGLPRSLRRTWSMRGGHLASLIDPRQVRARVFALSADPASAEISMFDAQTGDGPALLVRVPAYRHPPGSDVLPHLLVRLIDPHSPDPLGETVLTRTPAKTGSRGAREYFEGVVQLRASPGSGLRADVFDARSKVPPASSDGDEGLSQARRAAVFLGEWRRLLALARWPAAGFEPARCLRELVAQLRTDGEQPLFAGGPSASDVQQLAELGDAALLARAQGAAGPGEALLAMTRGPGDLLVAEMAAAEAVRRRSGIVRRDRGLSQLLP